MYGRDPWGGPLEINAADSTTDDDRSRNLQELDRSTLPRPLDETQQSWLLGPTEHKKKKYVDLGCVLLSRKIFLWSLGTILLTASLAGFVTLIVKTLPRYHFKQPPPDTCTIALHKALNFFNAQQSGKLPMHNHVPWRGDSCLEDGNFPGSSYKDLVGGYYDAGDAIKFNFPMSFAMTMLSWSVIEYSAKYEAAGELNHVKQLIKWGTDYFLKTFNSSADTIYQMVTQVGSGNTDGPSVVPNDHYCWMRPEDIDYQRPVSICYSSCSDLAAEMAAALASASIVFKDDKVYSRKLVHGAKTLHEFAKSSKGRYSPNSQESSKFYNSTMYWDELIWGGAWMYFATGNVTYLDRVTSHALAKNAGAFSGGPYYGVFSWDNKLAGAQVLLSRLRLFLSPGYPYEDMLSNFHNQTNIVMCSFLPYFNKFNRTKGGLIQLNHGDPQGNLFSML